MKRRFFAGLVAFIIAFQFVSLNTVYAAGLADNWIELLEYTTVNGVYNDFSYGTSRILTVPMPRYMRVSQVDILLNHTNGTKPDKVEVSSDGSSWRQLQVVSISSGVTRVFGNAGNSFYDTMQLRFTRSSSATSSVDVTSFKVYTLPVVTTSNITGSIVLKSRQYNDGVSIGNLETISGVNSYPIENESYAVTASLSTAYAYDFITLSGYVNYASLSSARVMYGSQVVPFDVSFIDVEAGTTWNGESSNSDYFVHEFRNYYFSITADLSSIDRASMSPLVITFTGEYNTIHGMKLMLDSLQGGLVVADESGANSWNRFKNFISEKFTALGSSISTGFSNVSTWISNQTTTLNSGLTNVRTTLNTALTNVKTAINNGFTNVGTWISTQTQTLVDRLGIFEDRVSLSFTTLFGHLQSYFGQDDSAASDFEDDAADQSDDIGNLNDNIQNATRPPVENIDTSLDGYLDPNDSLAVSVQLARLTGDPLVVSMLMISLTIALVSYILFGKR